MSRWFTWCVLQLFTAALGNVVIKNAKVNRTVLNGKKVKVYGVSDTVTTDEFIISL